MQAVRSLGASSLRTAQTQLQRRCSLRSPLLATTAIGPYWDCRRYVASCPGNAYSASQAAAASASSASANGATTTTAAPLPPPKKTHYSKLGMDGFTDIKYNVAADAFLEDLENVLDDIDHPEMADINCSSGVLNLDTTSRGAYIINKQAPNVQLWLSSPISGPHHYDMIVVTQAGGQGGETEVIQWLSDNDGHSLKELLEKELSDIFEQDVRLGSS